MSKISREMRALWDRRPRNVEGVSNLTLKQYARFCAEAGSDVAKAWMRVKRMRVQVGQ